MSLTNRFTGTATLVLLFLKRDRIQLPIWILALGGLMVAFTAIYNDLYPTEEDLRTATEFYAGNPVVRLFGLPSGVNLGAYTLVESFMIFTVLVGLMSVLAVVRHTRQAEESRQAEMLGSTVVGRYTILAAALIVAILANVLVSALVVMGFVLHAQPFVSSLAAGGAVLGVGLSFSAVAGVTAQISSTSRGASGMAVAMIGAAFLLAAAGSLIGTVQLNGVVVDPAWPTWLSPIGWGQLMRPFAGDNWWLLLLFGGFIAAHVVTAFLLTDRRDVGRGLLSEGRGPRNAPRSLLSPIGLAWRLQRGVFFGWAAAMVAFGLVMGAVAADIEGALEDLDVADIIERVGGTDQIVDAYFVAVIGFTATVLAAYTVQVLLRMRIEETDGPLESILGTSVSRAAWMVSYIGNAVAGTVVLLLVLGASTGLAAGLSMGDTGTWLADLTFAALVQAPGTLVLGGLTVVVFAAVPRRAAGLAWALFAAVLVTSPMFAEMLNLPQALREVSPFTHTPALPAAPFEATASLAMLAVAVALTVLGVGWFRRRDLAL